MNSGELVDKLTVQFIQNEDNTYSWKKSVDIWGKAEFLKGINLFSKVGIGVKSIKFSMRRKDDLTLHNSLKWQGRHCFITDIIPIGRLYHEVTAALIEPVACIIEREGEPTKDELNRPIYGEPIQITFPGCLTEKYLGHSQGEPMAQVETVLVLVTPKPIIMNSGELITIGTKRYTVLVTHTLDEFKNEYEIVFKEDT